MVTHRIEPAKKKQKGNQKMDQRHVIDFVQMPWSKSVASWRYHGPQVWNALQQAVHTGKGEVHVYAEASANEHLEGLLMVSGGRFRASVTVKAGEGVSSPTAAFVAENQAAARRYFEGADVKVKASGNTVAAVGGDLPDEERGRMDLLLRTLWDLQLFVLRMFGDAIGQKKQTSPDVVLP